MPILKVEDYRCAFWLRNPHVNTIVPTLTRNVSGVEYKRVRYDTPDGDFFDGDWSKVGGRNLVIVLHGLEGSSDRHYIRGIVKIFNQNGWDALASNHRGCSGTPPRTSQIYHGGFTEDLRFMVDQLASDKYDRIALVGFSLGGNMVLKYLGEESSASLNKISAAVAISVPVDLLDGARELRKWHNQIYIKRFLKTLKEKVRKAEHLYKDRLDLEKVYAAKNFDDFDNHMTAPMVGLNSAEDFYKFARCLPYIPEIKVPTLLINAIDDTFLGENCYPVDIARSISNFYLQLPQNGGHVGFKSQWREDFLWSEETAWNFVKEQAAV